MSAYELHAAQAYETRLLVADHRARLLAGARVDRAARISGRGRPSLWSRLVRRRTGPVTLATVLADVRPALRSVARDRYARLDHLGNALVTEVIDAAAIAGVIVPVASAIDLGAVVALSTGHPDDVLIDEDRAAVIRHLVRAVEQAVEAGHAA